MASTRTVQCRHGVFTYHSEDRFLGASLRIYGEWSEGEVEMYDAFLKPSDVVIEVGANIGALTIPLSRRCKKVFAFEPQPQNYDLLSLNLKVNGISNVDIFPYAVGATDAVVNIPTFAELDADHGVIGDYGGFEVGSGSIQVQQRMLDDMKIIAGKIAFIKMDCEGSELNVLLGAAKLISRDSPLLYVENNRPEKSTALITWLLDHDYHCFWHRPTYYRENNFRKYADNIFGACDSPNMICVRKFDKSNSWLKEPVADPR